MGQSYPRTLRQLQRCNTEIMDVADEQRKENIWSNNDWEIPTIIGKHKTIDLGNIQNSKPDIYQK